MPPTAGRSIGLYFGSFNPIHLGHLIVADAMLEYTSLQEVWFVVSPQNPFKTQSTLAPDGHRLSMVQLAVAQHPRMEACDVELSLPTPSYTVHTLQHLRDRYPRHQFSLIMGGDNIEHFDRWRSYQEILAHHHIYVYPRPGHSAGMWAQHPAVTVVDTCPQVEISSTYIRERLQQHRSVRYLVPEEVARYCQAHHLYRCL